MRFLTLSFFLFFNFTSYAINKDSIRHTAVDKGSKYLSFGGGYAQINKDGKYFSHSNNTYIDHEYFLKNKYSIAGCLRVNYTYVKNEADNITNSLSIMGRKYFKIKKTYSFFAYSAISLVNANLVSRYNPSANYIKGGVTLANGIGFSIMPLRKKKNSLGRFGFDISINLLSFHTSDAPRFPYSTFGIKYRIK
ncbi:MAG: hypothetical protein Q8K70_12495 [Bacteroidota bacterium]|nr:hypothetical protein [Bacteroidota bacterium]